MIKTEEYVATAVGKLQSQYMPTEYDDNLNKVMAYRGISRGLHPDWDGWNAIDTLVDTEDDLPGVHKDEDLYVRSLTHYENYLNRRIAIGFPVSPLVHQYAALIWLVGGFNADYIIQKSLRRMYDRGVEQKVIACTGSLTRQDCGWIKFLVDNEHARNYGGTLLDSFALWLASRCNKNEMTRAKAFDHLSVFIQCSDWLISDPDWKPEPEEEV